MNNISLFLLVSLVLVIFSAGCINPLSQNTSTSEVIQQAVPADTATNTSSLPRQTYNNNQISFNYPTSWEMVPAEDILVINKDSSYSRIVAVSPRGSDPTLVSVQRTNSQAQLASEVSWKKQDIQNNTGQVLSERSFTLDGVAAVALTYEYSDQKYRFLGVYLEKNNYVYAIVLGAEKTAFGNNAGNFEMILNSFHVI